MCLTDTSLYIYICVKHFGMANIKRETGWYFSSNIFFFVARQQFYASSLLRFRDHTLADTPQSHDSSGRVSCPSQRAIPNKTQQTQETDIHATGGIRTRNSSNQAAVSPRLSPRGYRDGSKICIDSLVFSLRGRPGRNQSPVM